MKWPFSKNEGKILPVTNFTDEEWVNVLKWHFSHRKKTSRFTWECTEEEGVHLSTCKKCRFEVDKGIYLADRVGVKYWTDDELVGQIRKHASESMNNEGIGPI